MGWEEFFFLLIGLSWAFTGAWRWYAVSKGMLDQPNTRSSHAVATPRGGGVVFSLGWFVFMGVMIWQGLILPNDVIPFLPALAVIFVGIYDDFKGAGRLLRLVCQIGAITGFFYLIGETGQTVQEYIPVHIPWWGYYAISVFACVWMINLYNFMDGTDGFATLQGLIIFSLGGFALWMANNPILAIMAWSLCALLIGFLVWNWPHAKIFMGDSGSATLGLLVCMFAFLAYHDCQISLWFWIVLSSPFWFDATITLLRRLLAREKIFQPHRLHAYQRLVQMGWSHEKLLLWSMLMNSVCVILAYQGLGHAKRWPLVVGIDIVYLSVIYLLVEMRKPMYRSWYKAG